MLFWYSLLICIVFRCFFDFGGVYLLFWSVVLFFSLKKFISLLFRIEFSTALDTVMNFEGNANSSQIVACCTFAEKINEELLVAQIKQRVFLHKYYEKLQKIFVSKYGLHYWKKASNFSVDDHIEVLDVKFSRFDEILEFMNRHASEIKFAKEIPAWKIFIANNLPDNQSAIIVKIHHSMADGLSLMSFLLNLGDSKEYGLIKLPKIKPWEWIFVYLFAFFQLFAFFKEAFSRKADNHGFKSEKLTEKKNSYCSFSFDLKAIKNYAIENGISVNDVLLTLLTKALNSYHKRKSNKRIEHLSLMVAASVLPMPARNIKYPLTNNVSFLAQDLRSEESEKFIETAKFYHDSLKKSKSSSKIYLQKYGGELIFNFIHSSVYKFLVNYLMKFHSVIYTSVPGPTTEISLFNYNVKEIFFIVSTFGQVKIITNLFTYNNKFNFACFADDSTGINCKELVGEFTMQYNQMFNHINK